MTTKEAVQRLAGTYGMDQVEMLTCTVDSVDRNNCRCMVTPLNGVFSSFTAYLMADADDGLLILPAAGSTVKVLFSGRNAPTVVQYSLLQEMTVTIGDTQFSVVDGTITATVGVSLHTPVKLTMTSSGFKIEANGQDLGSVLDDVLAKLTQAASIDTPMGPGTAQFTSAVLTALLLDKQLLQSILV